jgi:vesicle-fusing ATPase
VDAEAVEKLMVNADDFEHALQHDVKPAFGHSEEELKRLLSGGLIVWSQTTHDILDKGDILIKQTANPETRGFVRVLLTGPPNSGKTYMAARIAKNSEFPFVKVCSPEDMVGFSEHAKCMQLKKTFEDAYRSPLSAVIIDDIEGLLDYSPIGMRYSNLVLQALRVLLKKRPPLKSRLLVLATSSNEGFLREFGLLSSFSSVVHVPRLSAVEHITRVLDESGAFSTQDIEQIGRSLSKSQMKFSIGIKHLLELVDYSKETGRDERAEVLLSSFEELALSNQE